MRNISLRGLYPFIFLILVFISINTIIGQIFFSNSVINSISAVIFLIFIILVVLFQPVYTGGQRGMNDYKNIKDITVVTEGMRTIVSRNDGA